MATTTTAPSTAEEESDEDMFLVPVVEAADHEATTVLVDYSKESRKWNGAGATAGSGSTSTSTTPDITTNTKRKKGRNPLDKEHRRIKRLLRNRVSAQQARERKKVYMNELEFRANKLQDKNLKLEEKISTLLNENSMLRKILMNIRSNGDESVEPSKS
ncbi:hypothetical protein Dimus_000574 [Dionaea muscipula]